MLRAVFILLALTGGISQLHSEEEQRLGRQVAITAPNDMALPRSFLRVQEPYCELGHGACEGKCGEDGGKQLVCPANSLPCYQPSNHCVCEEAGICKPQPVKRKTRKRKKLRR
jgi:hypothetical protein